MEDIYNWPPTPALTAAVVRPERSQPSQTASHCAALLRCIPSPHGCWRHNCCPRQLLDNDSDVQLQPSD